MSAYDMETLVGLVLLVGGVAVLVIGLAVAVWWEDR